MAGKVVKSSIVLLSKFIASRQESAPKTATSNIRKTIWQLKKKDNYKMQNIRLGAVGKGQRLLPALLAIAETVAFYVGTTLAIQHRAKLYS